MKRRKSKAQTFLQYALLIAICAGVLMTMRIFIVRAVQQKYRQTADVFGQGEQYAKGVTQVSNLDGRTSPPPPPPPPPIFSCSFVVTTVATLKNQVADLRARADSFDKAAADIEAQINDLKTQVDALTAMANTKEAQSNALKAQAAQLIAQADAKQKQIAQLKEDNPCCFGPCTNPRGTVDETDCQTIFDEIAQLEKEISDLLSQAEALNKQAAKLDEEVNTLRSQAESINASVLKLAEQVNNLKESSRGFRKEADDKEAQIADYKKNYPQCFQ